ncbi:hypothetical protein [Actinomadura chibensis]|uniref:Uncharacterized protein n=1 Tax=Actinomadura chibensis TaxID=392828 RepID=A0A5D0NVF9_9ACTN|nr:hypothetical protein [Actinomadura chibensis]TYB48041.1 hypothetical protein FXF69_02070 [Actinomadura chibensis]
MKTGTNANLYSWDVRCHDARRAGPGGISADRRRAVAALAEALSAERGGASGAVWAVRLKLGRHPEYSYDGLIAKGFWDPASGAVTVEAPRSTTHA